ncbi:hypothetical protein VNO80_35198 [Phaseolus coccineus]|uniref:Uncharacterized protein n=1 Tax=Phaseolus coccineus TaxID=3886 RepID=A0AAN9KU63_PHACN
MLPQKRREVLSFGCDTSWSETENRCYRICGVASFCLFTAAKNERLRKKALWGISSSAKEGRWKVFFVDSHRSLTVLYRGGLYLRAISFEYALVPIRISLFGSRDDIQETKEQS